MANGTNAHQNKAAVMSDCNGLECSPSKSSPSSPIYGGGSRATGHGVKASTSHLSAHGNSTRAKHKGSKTNIGKKNMSHQKSSGR